MLQETQPSVAAPNVIAIENDGACSEGQNGDVVQDAEGVERQVSLAEVIQNIKLFLDLDCICIFLLLARFVIWR